MAVLECAVKRAIPYSGGETRPDDGLELILAGAPVISGDNHNALAHCSLLLNCYSDCVCGGVGDDARNRLITLITSDLVASDQGSSLGGINTCNSMAGEKDTNQVCAAITEPLKKNGDG